MDNPLRIIFLTLLLLGPFFHSAEGREVYISNPPKGWECIDDPTQLPQKVKAIYISKGSGTSQFTPSLNIAIEPTSLQIKEYVKLAVNYHQGLGDTTCRMLGKVKTLSGDAELIQIDRASQWGEVRFMQGMLIKEGMAYVITATCLKKDFNSYSGQLLKSIQSLNIPQKTLPPK